MAFWWVNHKQTHKEEIEGGYIWSPKTNNDGSRNQTYINLTRAHVSDTIFSYAYGEIKAVGIIEDKCRKSERPSSFGDIGNQWNENGWLVPINWLVLEKPFSPKSNISLIAPLLPERYSPIQANGKGNQKCYLAEINNALGSVLLELAQSKNEGFNDTLNDLRDSIIEDEEKNRIEEGGIAETEKEQLIKARRGQGLFRIRLERIEKACRLTGVKDKRLLIASHIKPWRKSTNAEKLDGNNGLLLSPHVDRLFDRGWISFLDNGEVLCANTSISMIMEIWGLDSIKNVGEFNEKQRMYLAFHRENIYKG
jgi:hypothetical protein